MRRAAILKRKEKGRPSRRGATRAPRPPARSAAQRQKSGPTRQARSGGPPTSQRAAPRRPPRRPFLPGAGLPHPTPPQSDSVRVIPSQFESRRPRACSKGRPKPPCKAALWTAPRGPGREPAPGAARRAGGGAFGRTVRLQPTNSCGFREEITAAETWHSCRGDRHSCSGDRGAPLDSPGRSADGPPTGPAGPGQQAQACTDGPAHAPQPHPILAHALSPTRARRAPRIILARPCGPAHPARAGSKTNFIK